MASHEPLSPLPSDHRSEHAPRRASRRDLLLFGAAGAATLGCASRSSTAAPTILAEDPFAHLVDQRDSVTPITEAERAARRARLGELLAASGHDAFFCEAGATMTYLADVRWGHSERVFGLVVTADGDHFWICPYFEAEKARLRTEAGPGGELVTWDEHEYARGAFARAIAERGLERWTVDPDSRLLAVEELRQSGDGVSIDSAGVLLAGLRGVKDAHELALIRHANELTQQAIVAASEHVRPGMTATEISGLMRGAQEALGLRGVWVLALVGPAAAYPHGNSRETTLGKGDFLLVDTGGSLHGYQSDNTRTWAPAGQPDAAQVRAWHAVRDAQRKAFDVIRPGVECREVDRVARASLEAAGYGEGYSLFTHRLGHGIGLQGHEQPYFDLGSEVVLQEGMTLSNEPGIYVLGEFGVRIEDIIAVTADGADHFGDWQAGPTSPASTRS